MADVLRVNAAVDAELVLAVNHASGPGQRAEVDALTAQLPESVRCRVAELAPQESFEAFVDRVCRECRESGARLFVLGGDGTACAFAARSAEVGIALGLLPGGTFNYAARALKIDPDPVRAIRQLLNGSIKKVMLPEVNGRLFLVNLSLGLHRDMIDTREQLAEQIGRSRLTALLGSLWTMLRPIRRLSLAAEFDRQPPTKVRASGLYITSNRLLQERIEQISSSSDKTQKLTLATLREPGVWSVLKGLMAGATGARLQVPEVSHHGVQQQIRLTSRRKKSSSLPAVLDGERVELRSPVTIAMKRELQLIVPTELDSTTD